MKVPILPSERVERGRVQAVEGPIWFVHPLDLAAWDSVNALQEPVDSGSSG